MLHYVNLVHACSLTVASSIQAAAQAQDDSGRSIQVPKVETRARDQTSRDAAAKSTSTSALLVLGRLANQRCWQQLHTTFTELQLQHETLQDSKRQQDQQPRTQDKLMTQQIDTLSKLAALEDDLHETKDALQEANTQASNSAAATSTNKEKERSLAEEVSQKDVALSERNAIKRQLQETTTNFTGYKTTVFKDMRGAKEKVKSLKGHYTSRVQSLEATLLQKDAALSELNSTRTELQETRTDFLAHKTTYYKALTGA